MREDTWFTHFIIGALLVLGLIVIGIVGLILVSLWEAGFGVFVLVTGLVFGFCWVVHKLASSDTVKGWLDV